MVRKLGHTVQRRPGAHEPNERTRSNQEHLPLTHQINSWVYSVACRYTQNSIHLKGLVRRGKEAEKKFHVKLFPLLKWSICNLMETRLSMSRLCTTLSLFWSMNLGKTLSFRSSKEKADKEKSKGEMDVIDFLFLWTSGKAVSGMWTPSTLFFLLFEFSPLNIYEVKSFFITNPFGTLGNQSFSHITCLKWRTSIHLLIFFRWKPTSI